MSPYKLFILFIFLTVVFGLTATILFDARLIDMSHIFWILDFIAIIGIVVAVIKWSNQYNKMD